MLLVLVLLIGRLVAYLLRKFKWYALWHVYCSSIGPSVWEGARAIYGSLWAPRAQKGLGLHLRHLVSLQYSVGNPHPTVRSPTGKNKGKGSQPLPLLLKSASLRLACPTKQDETGKDCAVTAVTASACLCLPLPLLGTMK